MATPSDYNHFVLPGTFSGLHFQFYTPNPFPYMYLARIRIRGTKWQGGDPFFVTQNIGSIYWGDNRPYILPYTGEISDPWIGTVHLIVYGLGTVSGEDGWGNFPIEARLNNNTLFEFKYSTYIPYSGFVTIGNTFNLGSLHGISGTGTYTFATFYNYVPIISNKYVIARRTFGGTNIGISSDTYLVSSNEYVPFTESNPKSNYLNRYDYFSLQEIYRFTPRRYDEQFLLTEQLSARSIRIGRVTDWMFRPQYKLLFGTNQDFATTNWHVRINSYGNIRKSLKHWTGDYEVGNCELEFIDELNELYGSLYGNGKEARYKEISLSAIINDYEYSWVQQFKGEINRTDWENGKLRIDLKDKMKDLPSRQFVYDYQNLGTYTAYGKKWGCVNRIFGTQVMFDDYGDIRYIQTKQKGVTFLETVLSGVLGGALGFIRGGPLGAGIGFGIGAVANLPTKDRNTGGYYEISDYNVIPDDLVKSGQKIKFYGGSINGIATNLNSPLARKPEYTIKSGTFRNGILGTFSFENVDGININDFVYIKKPIVLNGNPKDIIYGLLCGSNINYPYNTGWIQYPQAPPWGGGSWYNPAVSDFSPTFESELNNFQLFQLQRIILSDEETTPFEEIKSLCSDLQLSFYIDENNKFAIRSIKPRGLSSTESIATYSWDTNILDGFKFSRSIDDIYSGIKVYYNYMGDNQESRYNGYDSLIEINAPSPVTRNANIGSIFSKWIVNADDASIIGYRTLLRRQKGIDRVIIPTTLFGVLQNVGDIIRVTHPSGSLVNRLFEIEGYDKDFDNSKVILEAIDAESVYGFGNCKWEGTFIPTSQNIQSGISVHGPNIIYNTYDNHRVYGSLSAFGTILWTSGINMANWVGRLIMFGSNALFDNEICYIEAIENWKYVIRRGLFNTISKRYFQGEPYYDLGYPSIDFSTGDITPITLITGYNLGTTYNINRNIGTSFKFF